MHVEQLVQLYGQTVIGSSLQREDLHSSIQQLAAGLFVQEGTDRSAPGHLYPSSHLHHLLAPDVRAAAYLKLRSPTALLGSRFSGFGNSCQADLRETSLMISRSGCSRDTDHPVNICRIAGHACGYSVTKKPPLIASSHCWNTAGPTPSATPGANSPIMYPWLPKGYCVNETLGAGSISPKRGMITRS